jgi:N-carbamoyl-L-amino-acid hydrolase
MAVIGRTPGGGVQRLALSDEDRQARALFVRWLEDLGLAVSIDRMGNIFGLRPGRNPALPPVMTGSHLDTQPFGGRFDGALGVLGGLEVMRTLTDRQVETEHPVVLVNWTNEEGCRFAPAMFASGVWAGRMDLDDAYSRTDRDGRRFGDALAAIGYCGSTPARKWPFKAYLELHIEQGPHLERQGRIIGIPKGILGAHWFDVTIDGTANQVGPTPMAGRNDALCAAAEMILAVNELPARMNGEMVTTVGEIHNFPNSRNIIPGGTHFTVDMRAWDDDLARQGWESLVKDFKAIADRRGCHLRTERTMQIEHTPFDANLTDLIRRTADQLGLPTLDMVSGAGHDAIYMAHVGPTAMIFVPSINGRSHVEVEDTKWEDCAAGTEVLYHAVVSQAVSV